VIGGVAAFDDALMFALLAELSRMADKLKLLPELFSWSALVIRQGSPFEVFPAQQLAAFLMIDPYNDFISEGGKV